MCERINIYCACGTRRRVYIVSFRCSQGAKAQVSLTNHACWTVLPLDMNQPWICHWKLFSCVGDRTGGHIFFISKPELALPNQRRNLPLKYADFQLWLGLPFPPNFMPPKASFLSPCPKFQVVAKLSSANLNLSLEGRRGHLPVILQTHRCDSNVLSHETYSPHRTSCLCFLIWFKETVICVFDAVEGGESSSCWYIRIEVASYRTVAFCVLRQKSLTPVSSHFLPQESIPSDYLRKLPASHWASH